MLIVVFTINSGKKETYCPFLLFLCFFVNDFFHLVDGLFSNHHKLPITITVTSNEHYWWLRSPDVWLCVQQLVRNNNKKNQNSAYCPFVKGIHQWLVDSPRKGPVMQKLFPCHNQHLHDYIPLTYKQLEMHGCIFSAVVTDALVLKYQAIRTPQYELNLHCIALIHAEMLHLFWTMLENKSTFWKRKTTQLFNSFRPSDAYMRQ